MTEHGSEKEERLVSNSSGGERPGNSTGTSDQTNPEEVRTENRDAERTGLQLVIDGIGSLTNSVRTGKGTDISETSSVVEILGAIEQIYKDASDEIIEQSEELQERAASEKTSIEMAAVREDQNLIWDEEEVEQTEQVYNKRLEGGEVDGSHRFGAIDSIVNTSFLMEDVVNMRNIEDDSYTQGEKEGTSLPFLEQAALRDEKAQQDAHDFHEDMEGASNALDQYIGLFNLDERLEAYEASVDRYKAGSTVTDDLEELDDIDDVVLEDINSEIDGEISRDTLEEVRSATASVGEDLNNRENGYEAVELAPEARQKAEELARQEEARALDRVALHADRLETAREEIGEIEQELQDKKEAVENYVEDVEDLTRVDGIKKGSNGNGINSLMDSMGVDTILDLATHTPGNFNEDTEFLRWKEEHGGVAVPDPSGLISNAYDALNEIAEEYDALDFTPTKKIQAAENYHPKDQTRRQMEAVYDSSEVLTQLFGALEGQIPDLDEYDPEWEGDYDSLEEERQEFYEQELGITDLPEPEEALNYERMQSELEE